MSKERSISHQKRVTILRRQLLGRIPVCDLFAERGPTASVSARYIAVLCFSHLRLASRSDAPARN
jgi:hypothetical protein